MWKLAILALGLAATTAAQEPRNFLQEVLGSSGGESEPLLGPSAPRFALLLANLPLEPVPGSDELRSPATGLRFQLLGERRGALDFYRLKRHPDSPLRGDQVKLTFYFDQGFEESMTLDAGALQGLPRRLPNGRAPDNLFTNWGSMFYDREKNLAVGVDLRGQEVARHARRLYSRFTDQTALQLNTLTGPPDFEIVWFAWRPADAEFWWVEAFQQRRADGDPRIPDNFFPILAPQGLSHAPGETATVAVIPDPAQAGQAMELAVIDDVAQKLVARVPVRYELPLTRAQVAIGDWASSLYRLILVEPGQPVDAAANDLNNKLTNIFVRPKSSTGDVLFVAPTDMWYAYSTNGGHDYHGWRTGYDDSVGYSPTVMSGRRRRLNHFYYSLYERFNDVRHLRFLSELAAQKGWRLDFATQHDVALGNVRLDDYSLVLVGNHCEFTTAESYRRFTEYMGRGGAVAVHGGDSFNVLVEYLPSLAEPRYIWQRGHLWIHMADQPSDFRAPQLLPPGAAPDAPIVAPQTGDAVDYLNPFHNTVGGWIGGSKAVIADVTHPATAGMGLSLGDEVPGPWGSEVDYPYEPLAWDVLIRSDQAAPESRENDVDANDPTPLYRTGLAVHRNLQLGMLTGENFPNILGDPQYERLRELYGRMLDYLRERSQGIRAARAAAPARAIGASTFAWDAPVRLHGLRYALPVGVDFEQPEWHKKPAPYAHYRVQGSLDGETWFELTDRLHGPWRRQQTDWFEEREVRFVRFDGELSTGEPFSVSGLEGLAAR
ncbi:MAG: hypothetical protein GC160_25695 [Acidobacteria bacterium]|nr:hypothetical protein [Acidobacteriota bacterium]